MSSRHPCAWLILFHTIIIWTVYANAIIENDRRENMMKSQACNVHQYFGDSSCQANIKHYIADAINTVLARQDGRDENLYTNIRALFAKIETLERMMNDTLDRCTSNAKKGSSVFGNCSDVWIGASDISSEGQWYWLNGEAVTSILWHPGEPSNSGGNEDCGQLLAAHQYNLNDHDCGSNERFIGQIV